MVFDEPNRVPFISINPKSRRLLPPSLCKSANTPACTHYFSGRHPSNSPIRFKFIMSAGRIQLPVSGFCRLSQSVIGWGIHLTTRF
ncbi:hypothetical protein L1987_39344 [Smallanthus sonchifolius]|uniref:Uncharacterized protein n=1 Tax=Smallanthus sonchifolius TaxID=185202 RepID=A0ACB9HLS8_9ASTR|nr:hypothetical protein L1987_39344 [Smallanthus sonchifolius]